MRPQREWSADEAVHALLDGEASEDQAALLERRLDSDHEFRARLDNYRSQTKGFHALFDHVIDEPVPDRLRPAVLARKRRQRQRLLLARIAAAVLLLVAGGAAGWTLNDELTGDSRFETALTAEATAAHRVFVAENRHPVEVTAAEDAHLFRWLSNRLGADVKAPPLDGLGFALIGGRLLPCKEGDPGVAAQFMYQSEGGRRLTLYVARYPGEEETGFRFERQNGLSSFYWVESGFAYALIGETPRDTLLQVAETVHAALTEKS